MLTAVPTFHQRRASAAGRVRYRIDLVLGAGLAAVGYQWLWNDAAVAFAVLFSVTAVDGLWWLYKYLFRAPKAVHDDDQRIIADLQEKLVRRKANREIADRLTELWTEATRDLLPIPSRGHLRDNSTELWIARVSDWVERTKAYMSTVCTRNEMASTWEHEPYRRPHPMDRLEEHGRWVQSRVWEIARIAEKFESGE